MTGPGDNKDEDLDLAWPLEPRDEADMWPKERRRPRLRRKKRDRDDASPEAPIDEQDTAGGLSADLASIEPEPGPDAEERWAAFLEEAAAKQQEPDAEDAPAHAGAWTPDPLQPEHEEPAGQAQPAEPAVAAEPVPSAADDERGTEDEDPTPPPRQVIEAAAVAEPRRPRHATGPVDDSFDMNRLRALQDEATVEILDAVNAVDEAVRRVERVSSALASEMAEIAQALTDETASQAVATQDSLRASTAQISADIEALGETVADAIAGIEMTGGSPSAGGGGGSGFEGRILTQLAEASDRVEALLEDLVVAAEGRPLDPGELTARTAERFAEAMGGRVQAATADAVAAIDDAVERAVARAADQFRQLATPQVDRSTTSALERLEERVATISRQREEDFAETRQALDAIGTSVARMGSAHADDLERLRAAVDAIRQARPSEGDDRVAKMADALEAIANLPGTTDELVSVISEQTEVLNTELEAVRRRLALRARTTLDQTSLEHLADLVAARLREER